MSYLRNNLNLIYRTKMIMWNYTQEAWIFKFFLCCSRLNWNLVFLRDPHIFFSVYNSDIFTQDKNYSVPLFFMKLNKFLKNGSVGILMWESWTSALQKYIMHQTSISPTPLCKSWTPTLTMTGNHWNKNAYHPAIASENAFTVEQCIHYLIT